MGREEVQRSVGKGFSYKLNLQIDLGAKQK